MNIKFNKIVLSKFRSYINRTEFTFNNKGFYHICGETGSGKSSIFRALIWCLKGTDSEGIKGTNLKTWQQTDSKNKCYVELTFSIDDDNYTLYRQQSPNKLTLNDKNVDQKSIDEIFSFNTKLFDYIVFLSQFSDQFIHASSPDKLNIFTRILELEKWDKYSEAVSNMIHIQKDNLSTLQSKKHNLQGSLDAIVSIDYTNDIKNFDKEIDIQIKNLRESSISTESYKNKLREKYYIKIKTYNNMIGDYDHIKDVEIKYDNAQLEKLKIIDQIKELSSTADRITANINYIESDLLKVDKKKQTKIAQLNNSQDTHCSACGQIITPDHINSQKKSLNKEFDNEIKELNKTLSNYNSQLKSDVDEIDNLNKKLKVSESKLIKIEKQMQKLVDLGNQIKYLDHEIQNIKSSIESLDSQSKGYSNRIKQLTNKTNPYLKNQREVSDKVNKLNSSIDIVSSDILEKNKLIDGLNFWTKGFKEIKLSIVQNSINEFNFYCNDNLNKLGLFGWKIENGIDKLLKNGNVKSGFTTTIITPDNEKEMPLEVYSGGEHQRLQLAIVFSLIDLLSSVNDININIEIYDEPTKWLSNDGINDLLQVLSDRAERKGVYIIDHRDFKDKVFDNVFKISKSDSGSSVA